MTKKTKTPKAATLGASKKPTQTISIMPKATGPRQPLPKLSELLNTDDLATANSPYWVLGDLAEDAENIANAAARGEFIAEAKKLADDADVGDLLFLVRAFRHARANHGEELALPGRALASILFGFEIHDLGTGRRDDTRRLVMLSAARERLRKQGVKFHDDAQEGV